MTRTEKPVTEQQIDLLRLMERLGGVLNYGTVPYITKATLDSLSKKGLVERGASGYHVTVRGAGVLAQS